MTPTHVLETPQRPRIAGWPNVQVLLDARGNMLQKTSYLQILSLSGRTGASGPNARPLVDPALSSELGRATSRLLAGMRRARGTQQRPKFAIWSIVQVCLNNNSRGT